MQRLTLDPLGPKLRTFTTRRATPPVDLGAFTLPDWPPDALEAARLIWRRRVVNERISVDIARRLARATSQTGVSSPELAAALQRLENDEQSHVALAAGFLDRLGATSPPIDGEDDAGDEPPEVAALRLALTGLAVCETVSAARLAAVRKHTDLEVPRACIESFLRDEVTHGELGFLLVPPIVAQLALRIGENATRALIASELRHTFRHLDRVIGLDAERTGRRLEERPQPAQNPGIVEPAIDAVAFYEAIHQTICPRLDVLGLDATAAWTER